MGPEHPRENNIIDSELPCLSDFFKSFKKLNRVFNGEKEVDENRWISSSIFYIPTILRRKGPSKKCSSPMEMLIPNHFGLKEESSCKMDIKSIFSNSHFISQDDFNLKFGTKINTLNYMSLKKTLESNLIKTDGSKLSVSEKPIDTHWANNLTDLFLRTTKVSKTFRKIFNNKSKVKINYNKDRWANILKTNRICTSEILSGYRNMQTRYFPRQLLDFKARLLLGKHTVWENSS